MTTMTKIRDWTSPASCDLSTEEDYCFCILGNLSIHIFRDDDTNIIPLEQLKEKLNDELHASSLFALHPDMTIQSITLDMSGKNDVFIDGRLNNEAILDICNELKSQQIVSMGCEVYSTYNGYNEKIGLIRDIDSIMPRELAFS